MNVTLRLNCHTKDHNLIIFIQLKFCDKCFLIYVIYFPFRNAVFCQMQSLIKKIDVTKPEKGNEINIYVISDSYGNKNVNV